eukprot:gene5364-6840_t
MELKRKAESLKVESDELSMGISNESLPRLNSVEFQAMIDELKVVISARSNPLGDELTKWRYAVPKFRTEKRALTYETSGNARLDFFFKVTEGSTRPMIRSLLDDAWAENSLDTLQLIAQLRDVRGGKSDRSSSHFALEWLLEKHPLTLIENLGNLAEVGYWKDLL